jgi:ATP-binding protein involved in chromosome partitioning
MVSLQWFFKMAALTDRDVLAALHTVINNERGGSIVSLDMVKGVTLRGGNVAFMIEVDAARGPHMEPLRKAAEDAVMRLPGVTSVSAVLTAERATPAPAPAPQGADVMQARRQAAGGRPGTAGAPAAKPFVPGVKHIVAVASGKGGVGKSTVAVNLALGLVAEGKRVGLLDADIYGPSVPRMMGIKGKPEPTDDKRLKPMEAYGLKCMSMGFLVPEDSPMIWRGPMVIGALEQLLRDVAWGELDVLIVDMPPGTGDAQLTMAQRVPLAGAVIVSTPQDIALLDARKGINMFKKVEVPLLGIVENMSTFVCPNCNHESHIFGHGGAKAEAEKIGVECLGEIPLHIAIRETSDAGTPITATQPDSPQAKAYRKIAARLWEKLDGTTRKAPRIVVS